MSKKQSPPIAVELKNVTKTYTLHHEKPTFIENVIKNGHQEQFAALKNTDIKIVEGERVGIVGANGSGKTTLLKIIAGITSVDSGLVKNKGKVVSLIDLGAGFHPDLTGEENIFLNGLVIGMTKQEIKQQFNNIIKFADIDQFIDAPLYTYSAGMRLKLGFSIAVHSDPDILLIDEGFAVGDENFREKARKKNIEFKKQGKTLVMVGHWLWELGKSCDRFLWLDNGEVIKSGGKSLLVEYQKYHFSKNGRK